MFAKKDIIYSSTIGLCTVTDVTRLSADKSTPVPYYVMRSFYDQSKIAYIPVENHQVELRELISKEDALTELNALTEAFKANEIDKSEEYERRIGEIAYVIGVGVDELISTIEGTTDDGDE